MEQLQHLADFFASYEAWKPQNTTKLEYDYLLKGTHAWVSLPLWASDAIDGNVLWNQTTLKVITWYKKYDFQLSNIDGNPPDYIGSMLYFLQHLQKLQIQKEYQLLFCTLYLHPTLQKILLAFAKTTYVWSDEIRSQMQELQVFCEHLPLLDIKCYPMIDQENVLLADVTLSPAKTYCSAGVNNCGGDCHVALKVQENCILSMVKDEQHTQEEPPITCCARGMHYHQTYLTPQRLRYPMKRIGKRGSGTFERISWQEACEMLAKETGRIGQQYGPGSRYNMYATGVEGALRPGRMIRRLMALDGGYLDYYNSYSSACIAAITPYIYGTSVACHSQDDVLNTKLLILWGHNPKETIFGEYTNHYLRLLKAKKVPIIVIDPRRSDTVKTYADQWIPIRPTTDSALIDAMCYFILSKHLEDRDFLNRFCIGFDEAHMPEGIDPAESYESYLLGKKDGIPKTPQWASEITGVSISVIETLATQIAMTKPTCILPGYGPNRAGNGEQTYRSLSVLSCMTGNVGISGGSSCGHGDIVRHKQPVFPIPKNPFPGSIPTFCWTKAITNPEAFNDKTGLRGIPALSSGIKMITNLAGNTLINQHADINRTIQILEDDTQCEFIVTSDVFFTPSARYSDLVLPAASMFEVNNMPAPWKDEDYQLYSKKVITPLFEARFEYDWITNVADLMGYGEAFRDGMADSDAWLERLYEEIKAQEPELPSFDEFKNNGGYQYKKAESFVPFREQIEQGIPFPTPSGKIEIFSKTLYDRNDPEHIPAIPKYTPCLEGLQDSKRERYPLQLIGYHTKRRTHSIHDNNSYLERLDPPALWMHPTDAASRNIHNGELIEVFNDRGRMQIPAKVTPDIMEGVVALSQGGWYTPDQNGVDTRGCINVLTHQTPTPVAFGNAQHTNLVEVTLVTPT